MYNKVFLNNKNQIYIYKYIYLNNLNEYCDGI